MDSKEFFIRLNRLLNNCEQISRIVPLNKSTRFEMRIDKHGKTWEDTLTRDLTKGVLFNDTLVQNINVFEDNIVVMLMINFNEVRSYKKKENIGDNSMNVLKIYDKVNELPLTIEFIGFTL